MSHADWMLLISLCVLGAMSPGPSLLVVLAQTWTAGRLAGVVTSVSHGVGIGIYAFASAVGLSALASVPGLYSVMAWLGAGFLLYLAWRLWMAPPIPLSVAGAEGEKSLRSSAMRGFLIAFLNPKAALFFVAVFSQFVSDGMPLWEKLAMAGLSAAIDTGWYVMVAIVVGGPAVAGLVRRYSVPVQRAFALVLLLVALRVVSA